MQLSGLLARSGSALTIDSFGSVMIVYSVGVWCLVSLEKRLVGDSISDVSMTFTARYSPGRMCY